jgi:hypothetical protein
MSYPHKFIKLTEQERKRIEAELRRCAMQGKLRERKRLQVIYLSGQGKTFQEIQALLAKASYRSIKRWVSAYLKSGLDGLIKWDK